MPPILTVPGINNSGPEHWQSLWERRHPDITRIAQADWDHPRCTDWVDAIDSAVASAREPPLLLAHSLGCLAVMHWASRSERGVAGLVFVAVPDPDGPLFPATAHGFAPLPRVLPGRRVLVITSDNDPYANCEWTRALVTELSAQWLELAGAGHINAASGFGSWDSGWARVTAFAQP